MLAIPLIMGPYQTTCLDGHEGISSVRNKITPLSMLPARAIVCHFVIGCEDHIQTAAIN